MLRLIVLLAVVALPACAVVRVPVKVVGTAAAVTVKATGKAITAVTPDGQPRD